MAKIKIATATTWFRELGVIECISKMIPQSALQSQMKIWSAGCSNGSEPGSILALLHTRHNELSAECLATDSNKDILPSVNDHLVVSPEDIVGNEDAFVSLENSHGKMILKPSLRAMIKFKHEDLLEAEYSEVFDLVSCCNALYYYGLQEEKRNKIITNLVKAVKPDGFLVVDERSNRFFLEDSVLQILLENDMECISRRGIFYKQSSATLPPVC